MSNMAGIVDAKSNRQDNVDAGDDVNGDPPEVEEADEVDEGEEDSGKDKETEAETAKEEQGDDEHGKEGKTKVPPELPAYDLVGLPRRVDQGVAEGRRQPRVFDDRLDRVARWRVLLRP